MPPIHGIIRVLTLLCCLLSLSVMHPFLLHAADVAPRTSEQLFKVGERIYREGILENGEPIRAFVKGDIPVPGTAFTCISCHLRAGIGSVEGGVVTPPTNGRNLYQPKKKIHKGVEVKFNESPFLRPAYTDETLAEVIRSGTDPSGKVLDDVMPRYMLEDDEVAALVHYLKGLSSVFSPGITDKTIHFATVYSEDVPPEDRDAMLKGLNKFITDKNNLANNYRRTTTARDRFMARIMSVSKELEPRQLILSRWELKGPPSTWGQQLEEYNRKQPAFALLGGLVNGDWRPVHQFCETNGIPCIFPNTDFPVLSESDWYTLYISKGIYQEGEGVARYLNSMADILKGKRIVQISRGTREGRTLSEGFTATWKSFGQMEPLSIELGVGETLTAEALAPLLGTEKPVVMLIWDGADGLRLLQTMAATTHRPEMIFLSSSYLGNAIYAIPESVRAITFMAYPFRLPQDKVIEPMMGGVINFRVDDNRIAKQTYALVEILTMAIMEIKGNYYRDYLLDVIGMSMDRVVPLHERLSFGPGQRYASKGCYIVQLDMGPIPQLVKKSEWVVH
jgi:hypothetical protein